jgi:hypothetical protein
MVMVLRLMLMVLVPDAAMSTLPFFVAQHHAGGALTEELGR